MAELFKQAEDAVAQWPDDVRQKETLNFQEMMAERHRVLEMQQKAIEDAECSKSQREQLETMLKEHLSKR